MTIAKDDEFTELSITEAIEEIKAQRALVKTLEADGLKAIAERNEARAEVADMRKAWAILGEPDELRSRNHSAAEAARAFVALLSEARAEVAELKALRESNLEDSQRDLLALGQARAERDMHKAALEKAQAERDDAVAALADNHAGRFVAIAAGWEVEYDKPAYNETYAATFTFTPKKAAPKR